MRITYILSMISIISFFGVAYSQPATEYFNNGKQTQDLNEKIEYFSLAIKSNPYMAEVYFYRGTAYLQLNNISNALRDSRVQ